MIERLTQFKAVYCSGLFIPDSAALTAMALLFEKIYIPNNIQIVKEFVKCYEIIPETELAKEIRLISPHDDDEIFNGLNAKQKESTKRYLAWGLMFAHRNAPLFPEVIECDMFPDGVLSRQTRNLRSMPDGATRPFTTYSNAITFSEDKECRVAQLIDIGYVPLVTKYHRASINTKASNYSTRQLASLLAMKSVEMVLPKTIAADPNDVLEARYKLRDQLPEFWSSMLKFSVELKRRLDDSSDYDVVRDTVDLVDSVVRPALIDLATKLEKERRDWFYKILSPVQKGLRLLVGNPPITQQGLITSALTLAADTTMSVAENMRAVESMKRESGLTYLLDLSEELRPSS